LRRMFWSLEIRIQLRLAASIPRRASIAQSGSREFQCSRLHPARRSQLCIAQSDDREKTLARLVALRHAARSSHRMAFSIASGEAP
jgi:hypothetical protein